MNLKIFIASVLSFSLAFGAIPGGDYSAELEILSLPLGNQQRLLKSNKQTLERLVKVANDTALSFELRWKSIMALGFLEGQNLNPSYLSLVNSKEWFVKNGLLIALDQNNHPARFDVAKKLVKDPSLIVRSSAFDILMQESTHRDLLWEELFSNQNIKKKKSLWVRPKIINYMSENPKTYERAFFERLAKESEPDIVKLANKGLEKIKTLSSSKVDQITPKNNGNIRL